MLRVNLLNVLVAVSLIEIDLINQLLRFYGKGDFQVSVTHDSDLVLVRADGVVVRLRQLLLHAEVIAHSDQVHLAFPNGRVADRGWRLKHHPIV
jgi:hypothetical protein